MAIETALPFSLCKSKIHLFRQWSCYVKFINYVVTWQFLSTGHSPFFAIAFWSMVTEFRCDFFIMSHDNFWHIVHATVADFNCIVTEYFMKFVASWKMFCYQFKECLFNVYWNRCAKGWVEPYYVLLSSFLVFLTCCQSISNQYYNPIPSAHLRFKVWLYQKFLGWKNFSTVFQKLNSVTVWCFVLDA